MAKTNYLHIFGTPKPDMSKVTATYSRNDINTPYFVQSNSTIFFDTTKRLELDKASITSDEQDDCDKQK